MTPELILQIVLTISGAIAAYFALRNKVTKDAAFEADRLLKLRNERITHMEEEIASLKAELIAVKAQITYIEEYNITQLAEILARQLVHETPDIEVVAERMKKSF